MNRQRNRGFTLVELLAGIAIFALISGSLYGALGISVKAFDSVSKRTDAEQTLRVVSGFLQRSLEQGYPLALVNRNGWKLLFEGDAKSLRYVANLPGFLGYGGLYEMVFSSPYKDGHLSLVLERRPLFIDKARGELRGELEKQVLMEKLKAIKIRYYGRGAEDENPLWKEQWREAKSLPTLVEIQITTAEGDLWPMIMARPRVNNVRFQTALGTGLPQDFPAGSESPSKQDDAQPAVRDATQSATGIN
jgi:general secretion pathway protein J